MKFFWRSFSHPQPLHHNVCFSLTHFRHVCLILSQLIPSARICTTVQMKSTFPHWLQYTAHHPMVRPWQSWIWGPQITTNLMGAGLSEQLGEDVCVCVCETEREGGRIKQKWGTRWEKLTPVTANMWMFWMSGCRPATFITFISEYITSCNAYHNAPLWAEYLFPGCQKTELLTGRSLVQIPRPA